MPAGSGGGHLGAWGAACERPRADVGEARPRETEEEALARDVLHDAVMEPSQRLLHAARGEVCIRAAAQPFLDLDGAVDVFLLEHALLDEAKGLFPVRRP